MKTLNIENGYVTIQLSAGQCATLAKACKFASEETLCENLDHWRTFAALFHACTIAGYAQWHMCPSDVEALDDQLCIVGL